MEEGIEKGKSWGIRSHGSASAIAAIKQRGGGEGESERPMTYVIKNVFAYLVDAVTVGDPTRSSS